MKIINTKGKRKASRSFKRSSRGVTVMELIVTLSIGAILLTIGIPGFSAILEKNRIGVASSLLHTSFNMARGEALKRRDGVRICPSADSNSCRNDGDWSEGWVIFEDANSNNTPETTEIIRVVDLEEPSIKIVASASSANYLQFQPTGMAVGDGGIGGEMRICHQDSSIRSKVLSISAAGQIRLQNRTLTDCSDES